MKLGAAIKPTAEEAGILPEMHRDGGQYDFSSEWQCALVAGRPHLEITLRDLNNGCPITSREVNGKRQLDQLQISHK